MNSPNKSDPIKPVYPACFHPFLQHPIKAFKRIWKSSISYKTPGKTSLNSMTGLTTRLMNIRFDNLTKRITQNFLTLQFQNKPLNFN